MSCIFCNADPKLVLFDWTLSYGQNKLVIVERFERDYVKRLLERHNGNVSAAAREARMDRKHFSDLAIKHGLR